DITRSAGIQFTHTNGSSGRLYFAETAGVGCAFLDYNNDGKLDLFLVNSSLLPGYPEKGPFYSALYRNNGNGTFTDVTQEAGVADPRFSTSAAWLDYDRDGKLDLFVCDYARWTPEIDRLCPDAFGRKHNCGPTYYKGEPSVLYHNNGDGTFTDV